MEKTAWEGKFVKVTTENIGGEIFERAYIPEGVVIFPITDNGNILVIREKRLHETPNVRLKPVSGMLDAGESPEENAQRELQEEVGFRAHSLEKFWTYRSTGTVNAVTHFFLAKGLVPSKLPNPDGEDAIMEILEVSFPELRRMIATDEMRWGTSIMGFMRMEMLISDGRLDLDWRKL
jgi:8-oxo-dGTP pyrophosphatase MutT (NUDIX family)